MIGLSPLSLFQMFEWATETDASRDRLVTFYRLADRLVLFIVLSFIDVPNKQLLIAAQQAVVHILHDSVLPRFCPPSCISKVCIFEFSFMDLRNVNRCVTSQYVC